ncbi:hypothetical protein F2P79_010259 [Pimephales promelas]|nr:hypothetical protein F2P79_010259 [Pimephales promelas]
MCEISDLNRKVTASSTRKGDEEMCSVEHLCQGIKRGLGCGLRPCIDYRALNQVTVKFSYPLPLIPAALEQIREAKMFSKLDLRSAYNLIRIREGDEWKTAFITPEGHYEYLVIPYGLVNAPSVFKSFMDEVLRDFLGKFVLVYIDDILIYSKNPAEHQRHVSLVLQRLREFTLFLKAEKYTFYQTTVDFLGYVLSDRGVEMDKSKTETIMSWPTPTSVKELQRFLGFANFYRRFINQNSLLIAPLTSLLKGKPKTLKWTPVAEDAFTSLKSAFTTAPLLHHPDPERPFVVEVDASTTGVGGVLSQCSDCSSKPLPCAFFSKKFSPAEENYDIVNRELLAVKLALEEWRHWLAGAKHPFLVLTDHKNLQYLRDAKRLNPRQARWAPETILPESLFVNPIQWEINELQVLSQQHPRVPRCPSGKIYVPEEFRTSLISSAHSSVATGHPGVNKTLAALQVKYWWSTMRSDITNFIQGCIPCAISKVPRNLPVGKLVPFLSRIDLGPTSV